MKYHPLGRTGLSVSEICLGTMTWGTQNTEAEAFEQMDYSLANGVNFFDTAELYSIPPKAEPQGTTERVGKHVDLGGQSTSGTPQRLIFAPLFRSQPAGAPGQSCCRS